MVKFLDLNKQYETIKKEIDEAVASVITNSAFIGGPYLKQFEDEFRTYLSADYCIGVGNGTDALEIAIESLNLPEGSKIIVPANSFVASSEAVTRVGHSVLFCDVSTDDYLIDYADLEKRITPEVSAVIAVHLYGHPCNMDELLRLREKYGFKLIEDCAQAHGAEYKGKKVGSFGDIAAFSFYPGKNLGAYGDGGAIVTNSDELALHCRKIANHGRVQKYNHEIEGRNSRLDGLQAAILSVKLKHLNDWNENRREIADVYMKELKGVGDIILPHYNSENTKTVYHLFVVRSKQRNELQKYLKANEIQSGVHYPISLPKLKAYSYISNNESYRADTISQELISLPMGDQITVDEAFLVTKVIKDFFCND